MKLDKQVGQFLDRIAYTDTPSVINAYEKRIRQLEEKKIVINENIAKSWKPLRGLEETFRTALDFLVNPCNLWNSERLEDKRTVLKLAFSDRLTYDRNKGFRTAILAFPFKYLEAFQGSEIAMARPKRFELLTPGS